MALIFSPLPPAGEGLGERVKKMSEAKILNNAKSLRTNQTEAEKRLWYHLRAHRFMGLKFKRQKPMGRYIVDFVCVEQYLIVELDGGQHSEQLQYDQQRDTWLSGQGFTVLRFWNNDVMQQLEGCWKRYGLRLSLNPLPQPLSR
jgi:very-short-patch-repair endonuclease